MQFLCIFTQFLHQIQYAFELDVTVCQSLYVYTAPHLPTLIAMSEENCHCVNMAHRALPSYSLLHDRQAE